MTTDVGIIGCRWFDFDTMIILRSVFRVDQFTLRHILSNFNVNFNILL